ncbi:MAG: ribonuclease H-like domain-containing protein [Chloroflexota bacterium]|nr:ribonuclease H-like domain-containing protein [Chloroflexota bacterium]
MAGHAFVGWDPTERIVSIDADNTGRARVWRRVESHIEHSEHRFPNWFLTTSLELLAHLPAVHLGPETLRAGRGELMLREPLAVVELDWTDASDEDAYRYLVLTNNLDEVETTLVETSNKGDGGEAHTLADLRGLVLVWPPIEQFLTLTGRTYFKGMQFGDLRRFQFDLETTGLDEDRHRIFMISMRDSSGWQECLDTASLTEPELIERFVEIVRLRDPDVLENHNIFAFDLSFLVKRAARLGVRLALGRDSSEPWQETDLFDVGERAEPFVRWRIAGREVIDTQHAVRRFGAAAPDLRRHGLKDAARYFGFARTDREYVPGAEIWPTYRTDPDRIRRYAADDVDEVDGLSRRLLPAAFGLATMLPRSYERIASDSGPAAVWELLLVRAYLHAGHAIAAPTPRLQQAAGGPRSELFVAGVVGAGARACLRPLLPCVLVENSIAAANDSLGVMPQTLRELLSDSNDQNAQLLEAAAHPYLGGNGLFSDPQAALEATALARQYIDRLLVDLRARACCIVEVDGECVLVGIPPEWNETIESGVIEAATEYLPDGVRLAFDEHYSAVYARGPGSAMLLGRDGAVTLVGTALRASRLEPFGEAFIQRAAPLALQGDAVGLRQTFLETVHLLRTAQLPPEDLCVLVTLHKSPSQYRRSGMREEPYEVLLAAGVRSWRIGQRIRYFRERGGEPRLLQEGDSSTAAEADAEYYVQRLYSVYSQQFAQAFRREDFVKVFRVPSGVDAPAEADTQADLAEVRPIAEAVL